MTAPRALARVGNLAEAGYLASLLEAEGIPATIRVAENFNAVTGAWTVAYQLDVSDDDKFRAARLLRQEADARARGDEPSQRGGEFPTDVSDTRFGAEPIDEAANLLRPLTLLVVVAAVGWGFFARNGAGRNVRAVPNAEPAAALGAAVRSLGAPLYATDGPDRPLHRLRFDAENRCWELAIDADRDGRFETNRRFGAAAVGW